MPTQFGPESSEGCLRVLKTVFTVELPATPLFYLCDTPADEKLIFENNDQDVCMVTSAYHHDGNKIWGRSRVVGRRVGGPVRSTRLAPGTQTPHPFEKAQGFSTPPARSHLTVAECVLGGQAMAHSIAHKRFGGCW